MTNLELATGESSAPVKTPEQLAMEDAAIKKGLAQSALAAKGILMDPTDTRSEVEVAEHYGLI